jgi:heptosyltransferase III
MNRLSYLKDGVDFQQVQRVLVIKLQHLGDALLTTPVFTSLKQQYPHLQIDALVYADSAAFFREHPAVSQTHVIDRNWKKQPSTHWRHELRLLRSLKQRDYQLTISLTDRPRAAWLNRWLQPRYSVAPKTPKRGKFWRNSFSHLFPSPSTPRHTVESHLDALRRIGLYPDAAQQALSLAINAEAQARIDALLHSAALSQRSIVVIHPTSRWMFKAWNHAGFARVLELLSACDIATVVVSGPDRAELDYVGIITAHYQPDLDLSGQLSLTELSALLARARLFIGLDSVAMHMAAAVGTPCVALFGPSNEQIWGPWQVPHRVVSSADFPCRPCGLDGCGGGKISYCLQAIQAEDIVNAAMELLS